MGMTITEKILARAAGKDRVEAGDLVNARIDMIMCHDVTTPPAISMLKAKGLDRVFDPDKIVVTPDHFQPAKDIQSAELLKRLDTWAKEKGIRILLSGGPGGRVPCAAAGTGTHPARRGDRRRRFAHLHLRGVCGVSARGSARPIWPRRSRRVRCGSRCRRR